MTVKIKNKKETGYKSDGRNNISNTELDYERTSSLFTLYVFHVKYRVVYDQTNFEFVYT